MRIDPIETVLGTLAKTWAKAVVFGLMLPLGFYVAAVFAVVMEACSLDVLLEALPYRISDGFEFLIALLRASAVAGSVVLIVVGVHRLLWTSETLRALFAGFTAGFLWVAVFDRMFPATLSAYVILCFVVWNHPGVREALEVEREKL